jgi:hypothetical protein
MQAAPTDTTGGPQMAPPEPLAPSPPSARAAPSRSKATLSCSTMISAVTTSVSLAQKPERASASGATGVKSHHPWLRFLPLKRCQESRPTDLASGSRACCTASRYDAKQSHLPDGERGSDTCT